MANPDTLRTACLHGLKPTPEVIRALRVRAVPPNPMRIAQTVALKRGRLSYERNWLGSLKAAHRAAGIPEGPPRLLVRVDEFPCAHGYDDDRFGVAMSERFHHVMARAGVRYLIAVVPQWTHAYLDPAGEGGRPLDERDRRFLERMRDDGVSFGQHGLTHRTRDALPRRHSEFGGLDAGTLADLLECGRQRMAAVGCDPRVLVPPFNRFDAGQWSTLAGRYDIVTGGPESVPRLGFHGGPQWRGNAVYLPCYAPLYARARTALAAVEAVIEARVATWIPVVLHPAWEIEDDFAALDRLARRMAPYAESWDALLQAADRSRAGS